MKWSQLPATTAVVSAAVLASFPDSPHALQVTETGPSLGMRLVEFYMTGLTCACCTSE